MAWPAKSHHQQSPGRRTKRRHLHLIPSPPPIIQRTNPTSPNIFFSPTLTVHNLEKDSQMPLKRKRPIEEGSPHSLSQHSSSSSDLSSIASSHDADTVPTSDLATAGTNDITLDPDTGAVSIFSDRRVTNRTKTLVRIRENHKCWLCGFHGVHTAHVVARADAILLSSYIAQGLLPLDFGFHGLPNLMLLCAGCHHNFDVRIPIWTFLPSDLQGFVDREREFHRLRAIAATSGIRLQREHLPAEDVSSPILPYYHVTTNQRTRSRTPATSSGSASYPLLHSNKPRTKHGPATPSPRSYAVRASYQDTSASPKTKAGYRRAPSTRCTSFCVSTPRRRQLLPVPHFRTSTAGAAEVMSRSGRARSADACSRADSAARHPPVRPRRMSRRVS